MSTILDEARARLEHDFVSPSAEWIYLETLLEKAGVERLPLLRWVFEESPAYWETRAHAGMILLERDEEKTWLALQRLVASRDPDDHGTALTIFEITGDPRGRELAQDWLNEEIHPATQLEAIDFLRNMYPEKVWARVQALCTHKDPNIRLAAIRLASELRAGQ